MRMYIRDEAAVFIAVLVLILCLPHIAFAADKIWVDTVNGDDASADPFSQQTPVRTYRMAIALGAGDTYGIKVKNGSALPTPAEALVIASKKLDKQIIRHTAEIIPGHGQVNTADVIESVEAGVRITTTYEWQVFTAPNGQLAERVINITDTVEAY